MKLKDVKVDMILEVDSEFVGNRFKVAKVYDDRVLTHWVVGGYPYMILKEDIKRFRVYISDIDFYRDIANLEE